MIRWVECIVSEPNYFSLNSDYCPLHLALLDEVVSNHPLLHARVLSLFTSLFEGSYGKYSCPTIPFYMPGSSPSSPPSLRAPAVQPSPPTCQVPPPLHLPL